MSKSGNQKGKLIYILRLLENKTDENNGVTMGEILEYLDENEISAERKSIYSDIETLNWLGYDIKKKKENGKTFYYLESRIFSLTELKLLVDVIQSSRVIGVDQSKKIIKKLKSLTSEGNGSKLDRHIHSDLGIKAEVDKILKELDVINDAINKKKKLSFDYYDYDEKAELRKKSSYCLSPWSLVWSNDKYYLLAYDEKLNNEDNIRTLRVDKIRNANVVEESFNSKIFSKLDIDLYTKRHIDMGYGTKTKIKLLVDYDKIGQVYDKFGNKMTAIPVENGKFEFTVDATRSDTLYTWIMNYKGGIKLIWPKECVDEFKDVAKKALMMYEEN